MLKPVVPAIVQAARCANEQIERELRIKVSQPYSPPIQEVLILIFAAAASLMLQQWINSTVILIIVLGSTLLGFFQGYRASAAVAELNVG